MIITHRIKKSRTKTILIIVAIIVAVSNFGGFKQIAGINSDYYRYSNYSGTVTVHEIFWQGRIMDQSYVHSYWKSKEFERAYPGNTDTVLYRTFAINPLKFWRWGEYIFNWRYKLPYIDWKEVRKRRGYDLKYSNNFQEF